MDTPITKKKFLSTLHNERANWEVLLAKVDTSRITQPGVAGEWSLKDVIAHVAVYKIFSTSHNSCAISPRRGTDWHFSIFQSIVTRLLAR